MITLPRVTCYCIIEKFGSDFHSDREAIVDCGKDLPARYPRVSHFVDFFCELSYQLSQSIVLLPPGVNTTSSTIIVVSSPVSIS